MIPAKLLLVPIVFQLLIVGFDECYYHNRRTLVRGEQLGHALDTMTVLLCYALVLFCHPTPQTVFAYTLLSVASCLFITKDELLYHQDCLPVENFLHALAFLIHPVVLLAVGLLWPAMHRMSTANPLASFIHYHGDERAFIVINALLLLLFTLYELVPRERIWGSPMLKPERWAMRWE